MCGGRWESFYLSFIIQARPIESTRRGPARPAVLDRPIPIATLMADHCLFLSRNFPHAQLFHRILETPLEFAVIYLLRRHFILFRGNLHQFYVYSFSHLSSERSNYLGTKEQRWMKRTGRGSIVSTVYVTDTNGHVMDRR